MKQVLTILALMAVLNAADPQSRVTAAGPDVSRSLYARSAAQVLAREFSDPSISFLLLDSRTGAVLASRWTASQEAIPIGSLVKPITALAYAETHGFKFPEHLCAGASSCWLPRGHGRLGIVRATALSCNSYFTMLAAGVSAAQVTAVAQQFGLRGPGAVASPDALVGKANVWRESPLAVARAYAELLRRRSQPGAREIVEGMAAAAREGTAAEISRATPRLYALAKTGTAPCTHQERAPGDGFVVVAWPADAPRYLLMVRKHAVPGAGAAALAAQMLRALEPQP